jgi:hypothetical protein
MGRRYQIGGALLTGQTYHRAGVVKGLRSVIESGQDMRVNIDHCADDSTFATYGRRANPIGLWLTTSLPFRGISGHSLM